MHKVGGTHDGTNEPIFVAASHEVDRSLLRWSCSLSIRERLRAATNARRALSGFRRVPSEGG
jgi:hypothetical protein